MRRARWKRKNVRRVGLRRRRPPAAGGGWLAVPRGSQGRKRAALGETSSPGRSGIHLAPLFAAAGLVVGGSRCSGRMRTSAPTHFVGADLRVGPCEDAEGHKSNRRGRCPHRPVGTATITTLAARSAEVSRRLQLASRGPPQFLSALMFQRDNQPLTCGAV